MRLSSVSALLTAALLLASPAFAAEGDAPAPGTPPTVVVVPPGASAPPVPSTVSIAVPVPPTTLERPTYIGTAAPPTQAGTTPLAFFVHPGIEAFAQYAYTLTYGANGQSTWFHEFDVPRVHASLDGAYGPVRARVLFEGVQSTNDGSLIGVGGDSVVIRVREAYAAYKPLPGLELAGGVVPTLTIGEFDGTWLLRAIAPTTIENTGLASPADLGGTVRYTLPADYGWVAVGAYNGEGYDNQELNRGKNVEIAGEFHPLPKGALLPLAAFGSYVGGSSGTDSARANRATGGLLWQGGIVRAGATYTYAWGVGDNSLQESTATDVFVRVEPIPRLLLGARLSYWIRNTGAPTADAITTLYGSVGWRIADPLEFHLAVTRALSTTLTQNELAGSDYLELRAVTRVVF